MRRRTAHPTVRGRVGSGHVRVPKAAHVRDAPTQAEPAQRDVGGARGGPLQGHDLVRRDGRVVGEAAVACVVLLAVERDAHRRRPQHPRWWGEARHRLAVRRHRRTHRNVADGASKPMQRSRATATPTATPTVELTQRRAATADDQPRAARGRPAGVGVDGPRRRLVVGEAEPRRGPRLVGRGIELNRDDVNGASTRPAGARRH